MCSSDLQTRRVTRTTRTTVVKDENANARSRIVTRSKPPSSSNANTQSALSTRLTAPTLSTRPKPVVAKDSQQDDAAQGKRKRSTLGEVTVNKPKSRVTTVDKGKGKEDAATAPVPPTKFAGVVMKSKLPTTTATVPASRHVRKPSAPDPAPKRTTRSAATTNHVVNGKPALHVDAMVIDPPDLHVPPHRVNGHSRKPSSLAAATRRNPPIQEERERDEMEAESNRVFKKRRTSSDAPEQPDEEAKEEVEVEDQVRDIAERELQKHLHDIEREVEADPNGAEWEDLDAEDVDDPMMVSEYVNEIFEYLKIVEVRALILP